MIADVLVTVLRRTKGELGAFNEPSEVSWVPQGSVYAAEVPGASQESAASGQEMAFQRVSLRMRRNARTIAMTTRDKLRFRGEIWDVTGKRPATGTRLAYFDVDAVRRIDTDADEE